MISITINFSVFAIPFLLPSFLFGHRFFTTIKELPAGNPFMDQIIKFYFLFLTGFLQRTPNIPEIPYIDSREQRAKRACLHAHLATAARVKGSVACNGIFDCSVRSYPSSFSTSRTSLKRYSIRARISSNVAESGGTTRSISASITFSSPSSR